MINLLKKDILILKKYWFFIILFPIFGPMFLNYSLNMDNSGVISFIIALIFLEYILYGTLARIEEQYNGNILLSITPYSRQQIVNSKYIFIIAIFIYAYVIYTITALVSPIQMELLNKDSIVLSLLFIIICFSISIPLNYKYGSEKTKYIWAAFIFTSPMLMPHFLRWIQNNSLNFEMLTNIPILVKILVTCTLATVSCLFSVKVSTKLYKEKDFF